MKPFITDARRDGRYTLRFQLEGVKREWLRDMLVGARIVAYALPEGHSLECAWQCRFLLDGGGILEFSSACTVVAGWHEVGSLNIKKIVGKDDSNRDIFHEIAVEKFFIASIDCLVYDDPDVYSECGIVFRDGSGHELIIAAGVSPGSVSVKAPFANELFAPEFSLGDYGRVPL
ncbi:hypothetical protein [Burkholderia ubonensis]|uniref:hypothetical protein n=1 Tax=Burkholderia ubonensis TaxID=101571 RepID=UPI0012F9AD55|nr:hypothetical protein [Burkholderia ubonensis]